MRVLAQVPLLVVLVLLTGAAMLLPAAHALTLGRIDLAGAFAGSGALVAGLGLLLAVATAGRAGRDPVRGRVLSLFGAFLVLPPLAALPMLQSVPGLRPNDAWFEAVSAFTTTGATLYIFPEIFPPTVHLWRALLGWGGGLFVLVAAIALLAPLNLGGFEVLAGRTGQGAGVRDAGGGPDRLSLALRVVLPTYAGLTAVLWLLLILAGEPALAALCHAMATLSTSGISPVGGMAGSTAGLPGEAVMLPFLVFALTRQAMPGAAPADGAGARRLRALRGDAELRFGLLVIAAVAGLLFLRHAWGAWSEPGASTVAEALAAAWGAVFTVTSFLTTTGFVSAEWTLARNWSGLGTPGLVLAGLAIMGGGIATTAGGIKLLRIVALGRQGQRELERLLHPSSVGGRGPRARQLRGQGAYAAWLFVMLWLASLVIVLAALSLTGLRFESALVFSIAALTTTGPLAEVAASAPLNWALLSDAGRAIAAAAMILGRLETLAVVALLSPDFWRN